MLSIIITAWKEPLTIGKAIRCLLKTDYSGLGEHDLDKDWEFILIAPDTETHEAALKALEELKIPASKFKLLRDDQKGKPAALNICFKEAKGEYLLLTDGDVEFSRNAVGSIVGKAQKNPEMWGISAQPIAKDPKTTMLNYWGALLAAAANHKRKIDLEGNRSGLSARLIPQRKFFPLSGYGMLIRNMNYEIPEDCLIDDAYLSYRIYNEGHKLGYAEQATVKVKYPTTLADYFKQKKRSTGGYVQLWKYGVVNIETQSRSFSRELEYFWFPVRYARNFKELCWSLMLYPVRAWLWVLIYWERKVLNKDFSTTWVRIESTK